MRTALHNKVTRDCQIISGLEAIHSNYQAFLIDAWGVIHDGQRLCPFAYDCLVELRKQNKFVLIISNSSRRHTAIKQDLLGLGISEELYQGVISSGELTWRALHDVSIHGIHADSRGYYLGSTKRRDFVDGLRYDWVDDVEQADFILNTGAPVGNPANTADSESLLMTAAAKNIPMICANPDVIAIRGGQAGICAGALAARYSDLGATRIEYYGKPFAPIYRAAMAMLGGIPNIEVLAVGDAFATDILGAHNTGIDSCLIASGIHNEVLRRLTPGSVVQAAQSRALPTFVSEYFAW